MRTSRKLRSLFVWHRWIGAAASTFLLLLALTGIALNHTDALHLDRRPLGWTPLLDWYGIPLPERITAYTHNGTTLALVEERLYLDGALLSRPHQRLHGLAGWGDMLVAAVDGGLLLIEPGSLRSEAMDATAGLPGLVAQLGSTQDETIVIVADHQTYTADPALLNWSPVTPLPASVFSAPTVVDPAARRTLQQRYRQGSLNLERLILDLHSGRLFGFGPWLMDLVAGLTILLAVSGPLLWWRQAHKRRTRRQQM